MEKVGFGGRYKLRMEQPRFIIHSHNKVVVCIIKCSIPYLPVEPEVYKKFSELNFCNYNFEVKAVAKCNNIDEYSEETGIRIAESRAKEKALNKAMKIMQHYETLKIKEMSVVGHSVKFFKDELIKERKHIVKLTSK